jgi:hypothetical protein
MAEPHPTPGQPDQHDHETSPAEFLDADQSAYAAAAVRQAARQAAIDDEERRRAPYAQRRRMWRRALARRLHVG